MRTAIRLLSAACAGTALLACGSAGVAPPGPAGHVLASEGEQAVTALEQACVHDPLDPGHWEQLAQALELQGQGERAALMRRQAQSLRTHDLERDYALLAARRREELERSMPNRAEEAPPHPPQALARIEVIAVGGAMVQLRRVAAQAPAGSALMGQAASSSSPVAVAGNQPVRLEISNGNGVTGMAAALARTMRGDDVKVVRLTNVRPFAVPVSRVEYRADQQEAAEALATRLGMTVTAPREGQQRAEVRIVLGRDLLSPAVLRQRYLK
ncbi:LytR C-terminal domain-containing protein [Duganella sp. LX20W]|uniref:LytR C-terminal domain-containing protein n=1 Tax=Rugamonas brunnea TaxID=2758569 RepID=A0A7W2IAU9_9BURK|nr:LytR C-terminal domain-containing protein [Rugamonas brunnea]MBA5636553.1 LytR C-terminal domain-containing protein [Rugamonas brunnea]